MACDPTFPPSNITCMTLFFSLLLAFHFAMAIQEHTLTKDDAKKKNNMVTTSQNYKTNIIPKQTTKSNHVPNLQKGTPKGRNSRASRPLFQWKNKIFNASEHEVPSGPNPISNR
ncbi:unnamed protein product [Trifolium pratense]|uniref:Uncharacterized protein n=1 Tax=Trifolium pratense TaxID=57577 RepID=A0ACB0IY95_TRIPR|nr:unnamed protein product [Trifolium pratense]